MLLNFIVISMLKKSQRYKNHVKVFGKPSRNCPFLGSDNKGFFCGSGYPCRLYADMMPPYQKKIDIHICRPNRKVYVTPKCFIQFLFVFV